MNEITKLYLKNTYVGFISEHGVLHLDLRNSDAALTDIQEWINSTFSVKEPAFLNYLFTSNFFSIARNKIMYFNLRGLYIGATYSDIVATVIRICCKGISGVVCICDNTKTDVEDNDFVNEMVSTIATYEKAFYKD